MELLPTFVSIFRELQNLVSHKAENTFTKFGFLVIYHMSFFIFITTIGLNIIFGIIVDTFSELRNLKVWFLLLNFIRFHQFNFYFDLFLKSFLVIVSGVRYSGIGQFYDSL